MTLHELLNSIDPDHFVEFVRFNTFNNDWDGEKDEEMDDKDINTFHRLRNTEPVKVDFKLRVERKEAVDYPRTYVISDVSAIFPDKDEPHSISLVTDEEYVGAELEDACLDALQIAYAACDEMWWSNETKEDIKESIERQLEEIENGTAKLYTMDEVLEEFNDRV